MAEVTSLAEAYRWNVTRLGEALGLHRDTVRKRLNEAGIKPSGKKGNAPTYDLRVAAPALFAQQQVSVTDYSPDKMAPKDRKEWYQSENERLKYQKEVKTLIPDDEYRDDLAKTLKQVVSFFDSLPDRMERKRIFSPEQLEELEKACDELRAQLYLELQEVAD